MGKQRKGHVISKLPNQKGFILVLNTGAEIDAQAEAMLQALHSRSTGGIKHHLKVLKEKGAEGFMERFYVGYGHKSIGDCGSATVFVEGVSMLAAKAIQDWRLYSGQEASTRYVDFSKQIFLDPLNSKRTNKILEDWREFYLDAQKPLQNHLKEKFPIQEGENENIYNKAIAARAFDITRSFLPAGATTNVAWRMNFRQFADELMLLRHHPLKEVRDIADTAEKALFKMFPNSFGHERFDHTEKYNESWINKEYYHRNKDLNKFTLLFNGIDRKLLKQHKRVMEKRPFKTELPTMIGECGVLGYEFLLDFGSFRDLQRHRAVVQRMPLLTQDHGFEGWYLDSLPKDLRKKADKLIASQEKKIMNLKTDDETRQYYIAMGYRVPCRVIGDLKALTYLVELRSTRFVHPTLVAQMLDMIKSLKRLFEKDGLIFHLDEEPNRFDIGRGTHDIVEKK
ncbi:MAG: FAD-dependent thymidylate synthase [Candidatus Moranbacteria bacterium]|nr:FAD-dependent thymidylate synthase [Candidatus Moranbacteria bacterium]